MERRTDNDVRSLTTNAVSGGPHVYTLEYYPRIPERVSTKQTLFKEMLKFHEVRDGGERGDVYGEIEVNKIGKNVVRKKPVGGVSPDICVAECYPHYRFSVVSAQNDCLCFIAEKEIKKIPSVTQINGVKCTGDSRRKDCPGPQAKTLVVTVATNLEDGKWKKVKYVKQASNTYCEKGTAISTTKECTTALKELGLVSKIRFVGHLTVHNCPSGCLANMHNQNYHHFNTDMASTRHRGDLSPICLKPNVAANTGTNKTSLRF